MADPSGREIKTNRPGKPHQDSQTSWPVSLFLILATGHLERVSKGPGEPQVLPTTVVARASRAENLSMRNLSLQWPDQRSLEATLRVIQGSELPILQLQLTKGKLRPSWAGE